LKVAFIIPVWLEKKDNDPKMSPFLMPQIEALIPHLEFFELIYLERGFTIKSIRRKIGQLKDLKYKNADFSDLVVFSMYGSLHGFLVTLVLGGKFKIVNTFGGSDILGSGNTGFVWMFRNWLTKCLSFYTASRVNHIIVKSSNLSLALQRKCNTPLTIIPNGVDLQFFEIIEDRDKLRENLEWSPEEFIILFNLRRGDSKHEYVKNYPLAKEVMSTLGSISESQFRLEIINNRTHQEMVMLLNAADCLLLTSLHEGSPNIVKEAMACNLPIVTVECGDVKERLGRLRNSYVSSKYNSKELAQLCLKVKDAQQRSNGRNEIISQGLEAHTIANTILDVLASV